MCPRPRPAAVVGGLRHSGSWGRLLVRLGRRPQDPERQSPLRSIFSLGQGRGHIAAARGDRRSAAPSAAMCPLPRRESKWGVGGWRSPALGILGPAPVVGSLRHSGSRVGSYLRRGRPLWIPSARAPLRNEGASLPTVPARGGWGVGDTLRLDGCDSEQRLLEAARCPLPRQTGPRAEARAGTDCETTCRAGSSTGRSRAPSP